MLLLAACAVVLGAPRALTPAIVGETPADADLLFLQPVSGLQPDAFVSGLRALGLEVVETTAEGVRVGVPAGASPAALAARIAGSGLARSVEADGIVRAAREPDDTLYPGQTPYLDVIGAPAAWARTTGNPGIVIAVIDTGLDAGHPDLASRLFVNPAEATANGRDDDGNGCVDDRSGCSFVSPVTADPSCGYTAASPHAR
ncbi:MAG: hypothetical protein Q7V53_02465, partial [Caldisericota bacterium]|nr:hypothetical protein [Caldisericota bacterium]